MWKKKQEDVELVEELQVTDQEHEETSQKQLSQELPKPKDKVRVKFDTSVAFGRVYPANVTHEFTADEFKKLQKTSFKFTVV